MSKELIDAMVDMKEEEAVSIARGLLDSNEDPMKILDSCKEAMEAVGKRFEEGDYFLPELIMAGEILRQISEFVKPKLQGDTERGENDWVKSLSGQWKVIFMTSARTL